LSGYITRRRNHWLEAERDFSKAVALDPRNPNAYNLLADTYVLQRRFPEAVQTYERVMDAGEQTPLVQVRRASALFNGTGNSKPLREALASSPDMDIGVHRLRSGCCSPCSTGTMLKPNGFLPPHPG